jgi:hypothetical protein
MNMRDLRVKDPAKRQQNREQAIRAFERYQELQKPLQTDPDLVHIIPPVNFDSSNNTFGGFRTVLGNHEPFSSESTPNASVVPSLSPEGPTPIDSITEEQTPQDENPNEGRVYTPDVGDVVESIMLPYQDASARTTIWLSGKELPAPISLDPSNTRRRKWGSSIITSTNEKIASAQKNKAVSFDMTGDGISSTIAPSQLPTASSLPLNDQINVFASLEEESSLRRRVVDRFKHNIKRSRSSVISMFSSRSSPRSSHQIQPDPKRQRRYSRPYEDDANENIQAITRIIGDDDVRQSSASDGQDMVSGASHSIADHNLQQSPFQNDGNETWNRGTFMNMSKPSAMAQVSASRKAHFQTADDVAQRHVRQIAPKHSLAARETPVQHLIGDPSFNSLSAKLRSLDGNSEVGQAGELPPTRAQNSYLELTPPQQLSNLEQTSMHLGQNSFSTMTNAHASNSTSDPYSPQLFHRPENASPTHLHGYVRNLSNGKSELVCPIKTAQDWKCVVDSFNISCSIAVQVVSPPSVAPSGVPSQNPLNDNQEHLGAHTFSANRALAPTTVTPPVNMDARMRMRMRINSLHHIRLYD